MKLKKQPLITCLITLFLFMGITSSGYSDIICIGDDGHVEFETICLPCCNEIEKSCETEVATDHHQEHDNCSNCSDIEFDSPFLAKRIQKSTHDQYKNSIFHNFISSFSLSHISQNTITTSKYYIEAPPNSYASTTISFTIFLC